MILAHVIFTPNRPQSFHKCYVVVWTTTRSNKRLVIKAHFYFTSGQKHAGPGKSKADASHLAPRTVSQLGQHIPADQVQCYYYSNPVHIPFESLHKPASGTLPTCARMLSVEKQI